MEILNLFYEFYGRTIQLNSNYFMKLIIIASIPFSLLLASTYTNYFVRRFYTKYTISLDWFEKEMKFPFSDFEMSPRTCFFIHWPVFLIVTILLFCLLDSIYLLQEKSYTYFQCHLLFLIYIVILELLDKSAVITVNVFNSERDGPMTADKMVQIFKDLNIKNNLDDRDS